MTREFFKKCISDNIFDEFNLLEVDFRINVFSRRITKNFLIINDDVTVYRILQNSAMSSLKKFSARWWCKRYEAHMFMKELYKNNNLVYLNKVDFFMSKTLARILI